MYTYKEAPKFGNDTETTYWLLRDDKLVASGFTRLAILHLLAAIHGNANREDAIWRTKNANRAAERRAANSPW